MTTIRNRKTQSRRKAALGFTLVEMMVVISIMAITAAIALPNMSNWVNRQRVARKADEVANIFRYARAEAVRRNALLIACPVTIKADGKPDNKCQEVKADTPMQGLMVFADTDKDKDYDSSKDVLLRTVSINQNGQSARFDVAVNSIAVSDQNTLNTMGKPKLAFLPDGRFGWIDDSSKFVIGSNFVRFTLSDHNAPNNASRKYQMLLDPSGRAMVCSTYSSDSGNQPGPCSASKAASST